MPIFVLPETHIPEQLVGGNIKTIFGLGEKIVTQALINTQIFMIALLKNGGQKELTLSSHTFRRTMLTIYSKARHGGFIQLVGRTS